MSTVHAALAAVTERIRSRSATTRANYLARLDAAQPRDPRRSRLGCTNLAHGFAAAPAGDKSVLRGCGGRTSAIVSAYNDMLSAHQPYERFPARSKRPRAKPAPPRRSPAACRPCATA